MNHLKTDFLSEELDERLNAITGVWDVHCILRAHNQFSHLATACFIRFYPRTSAQTQACVFLVIVKFKFGFFLNVFLLSFEEYRKFEIILQWISLCPPTEVIF